MAMFNGHPVPLALRAVEEEPWNCLPRDKRVLVRNLNIENCESRWEILKL